MVSNKPWFDRLLHETGDFFCFGIVGGSAFNMSPKGERFIRGLQAVRVNAPLCASYCAVWGGLTSVFESSMKYVRQKDDTWTSILSDVAAAGLLNMRRGLGPSLSSSLIVSSTMELVEGYLVGQNRVASNLQSPQPNFEELHKKQKRGGIKGLCYGNEGYATGLDSGYRSWAWAMGCSSAKGLIHQAGDGTMVKSKLKHVSLVAQVGDTQDTKDVNTLIYHNYFTEISHRRLPNIKNGEKIFFRVLEILRGVYDFYPGSTKSRKPDTPTKEFEVPDAVEFIVLTLP
ncbi:unnamed protein product [Fraxinus pennsylvanica]|uniref:Uncharacterized protein n=1 Tax=Fraxinus pennsylvanica TaxID=56036 RepID=A0AAD2A1X6_9LAMI|nr:unnamed protein product [Fraxinus pennsylvanica]